MMLHLIAIGYFADSHRRNMFVQITSILSIVLLVARSLFGDWLFEVLEYDSWDWVSSFSASRLALSVISLPYNIALCALFCSASTIKDKQ